MTLTAVSAPATAQRAPHAHCTARAAVTVVIGGVLVAELALAGPSLVIGVRAMAGSSTGWLLIAAVGTCGSMVAFGATRWVTLRAGQVHVSLPATVAVSYAAGAIHASVPAGGVFSSVYAFRRIRAWGASAALATWSLAITGLLATATLAAVGLAGLVLAGGSRGSAAASILEIAAVVVVVGFLAHITRRPETLLTVAGVGVRGLNRLRGRPAENGFAAMVGLVAGLQSVRPGWRHWAAAVILSLLNWVFDLACLAACCAAFGIHIGPAALLLTYSVGMAAASLSPVPAGIGVTEAALSLGLTAAGAPAASAVSAVIVYRLLSTGSVVLVGWIILLANRNRAAVGSSALETGSTTSDSPSGGERFSNWVRMSELSGPTPRAVGGPRFDTVTTAEGSS